MNAPAPQPSLADASPDGMSPIPAAGVLSPPYRALTLGMVALISLCAFEALAVATAMPAVAQALNGLRLYALAFGGTVAASVVGITVTGRWCDRRGPALPLWNGVCWFVAGLLIAGLAPTMPLLLIGRVVQGFGNGAISVALYVVVGQIYPEALRPRIFAAFSTAWVLPSLIGPAISGVIVQHFGWRWVFLAVPLLALPAALMLRPALRKLPPVRPQDGAPIMGSLVGWSLLAACGVGLLHVGGQQQGTVATTLIAVGLAGLGAGAWRLLPLGSLRGARGLPSVIVLRGIATAAFFGSEAFIPLMLTQARGYSPMLAGGALTVGALGWSIGSWYQAHSRRGWSRAALLRLGFALMSVGTSAVAVAVFGNIPSALAVAGWIAAGLGMGLVFPSLSVLTLQLSAPSEQGANSSALQLCDSLSIATVLALGGSLFAALLERSQQSAFLLIFLISGVLSLLGLTLAGRVDPANAQVS